MVEPKELPVAPIKRIIKKIGKMVGVTRVSKNASEALTKHLEDIGVEISESSTRVADHAGRTTVKSSDVKMSLK